MGESLWQRMTSFEALWQAARRARRGKRYSASTALFEFELERELLTLHEELRAGSYRPGAYREFTVHEPTERTIRAAPYRDRVVHHAPVYELEPRLERHMAPQSYACRLGKGTHRALDRLQHHLRSGTWVLKLDIRKYFYTIDHALLTADIAAAFADRDVRHLCGQIISSNEAGRDYYQLDGDDLFAAVRPRGLPIGNLTSQLFANAFLAPIDRWITRACRWSRYVRYMDDLVLVGDCKAEVEAMREALVDQLAARRLVPHPRKTQVFPVRNGVPFLGFTVFPFYRRLRRANVQRFTRRLRRHQRGVAVGAILRLTDSTGQRDRANRVLRGGSWNNTSTNVRAANRNNNNGFRLASTRSARVAAPGWRAQCRINSDPRHS